MTEQYIYNTENLINDSTIKIQNEFPAYEVVDKGNISLSSKLDNFDFTDGNLEPSTIASRLISTCKQLNIYGLAANQCGLFHRVLVAGAEEEFVAFFNPVVIEEYGEILLSETDISNVGLTLKVKRPKGIVVQYQDYSGEPRIVKLEGLTCRIVCQGIDRLNGVDFTTKVSVFALERAKKALIKKVKKFVRSNVRLSQ